jgi:hypothetical protein
MKLLFLAACLFPAPTFAAPAAKSCVCTCVVKDGDSYVTKTGKGADREAAGESLKKALGLKKKCELTPDCKGGGCKLD